MSNDGIRHNRSPQGSHEEWLVKIGWKMIGLSLWEYPNHEDLKFNYSTDKAIAVSEELGLDLYCIACGACGIDGCCSPDRCMCLHLEQYDKDYKTLLAENEEYYNFIKKVSNTADVNLDELPVQASQLLGD